MKKQSSKPEDPASLRHKAEKQLKLRKPESNIIVPEADMLKLIHEFQVYQIELEMQNQELLAAMEATELAEKKYAELYDFAPSGYMTITQGGEISDLNFAAANLLGKERSLLLKKQIAPFISQETLPVFNHFLQQVFSSNTKQTCEAAITTGGNLPVIISINGIVSDNKQFCFINTVDITERKKTELALRNSEIKFRQLAENSNSIFYRLLLKPELKFDYVSPSATAITGYTPEDHYNDPQLGFKLVHPGDRILLENTTRLSNEEPLELRWIRKDGQVIWTEQRNVLLFDENNEPYAIEGNARDITDRKNMELGLRKDAERNSLLLDLFARAPYLTDNEIYNQALNISVRITESKIGFFHRLSDSQEAIILTTWNDEAKKSCQTLDEIYYPIDKTGNWADCLRQKIVVVCNEYRKSPTIKCLPEGHTPISRTMSVPVINDDKVQVIFGVANKASDYTDSDAAQIQAVANELHKILIKRQVEQDLRKSEDRWHFAIEGSDDGIWDWNVPAGDFFFSNRWKEMIGYGPDEIAGKLDEWKKRVHPDDLAAVMLNVQLHFEKKTPDYSTEYRILCKDGSWKWILARGKVLEWADDGKPIRMVGTHTDISGRKQAENEIRWRNEDLQLINAINSAANHNENIDSILNIIADQVRKTFNSHLLSIHLPNEKTGEFLMHSNTIDSDLVRNIKKLTGKDLPQIRLKINSEHPFSGIERSGKGILVTGKQAIIKRLSGYLKGTNWPSIVQLFIQKLLPAICNLLEYQSAVAVPMISNGKTIGYLELGSRNTLTNQDLTRIQSIGDHFAAVIVRYESEKKLRESEFQYRNLANAGSALIWTSGTDKLCNYFNNIWLTYTGRTLEQEMGNGWTEGVHPDDLARCMETYLAAFEKQVPFEMEYRLRHSSGEYRWIVDLGTPNFNSTGEFVGYIGHCFDISERKLTEIALSQSEEKYRSIYESVQEVYFEASMDGILLEVSPSIEKITKGHFSRNEMIGKSFAGIYAIPDERDNYFSQLLKQKRVNDYELMLKNKDGSVIPVAVSSALSYDASGKPVKITGILRDITERKISENELKETLEQLNQVKYHLEKKVEERTRELLELSGLQKAILANAPLTIMTINEDGIYQSINHSGEKMLGYSADEVVGKLNPLAFHDRDEMLKICLEESALTNPTEEEIYRTILQYIYHKTTEWTWIRKNGEKFPVRITHSSIIDDNGVFHGYMGLIIDITQEKLSIESLRKSEAENRAIIEAVPDLMFRIHRNGTYLDSHSKNESSLYLPREYFTGRKISEILPPDLARQSMQSIEKAFTTGEVVQYEYTLAVKDKNHYFENRIIAISNEEVLSIIRDITDRKIAETELQDALRKLSTLIQNLQAGTLFENESRHITLVNQSFCNLFNIQASPEQLLGYDCKVASEESKHLMKDPEGFIRRIDEILLNEEIIVNDELYLVDDRVLERDYIPIKKNDTLLGHLWQYRDITKRKKLYEELAEEKRRLADIIKGTNAGTWEWNIKTGKTIFNEQWAEIIGYSLEEITPLTIETWIKFAHPDDLKTSGELLEKHFKGELDYYSCESRMLHKNGNWIWVLDRGRVHEWDEDGKPFLMSGTHLEITALKRIEEALVKAKNEADKANKAKSEFLSRMSHELRTPMNSILGFAQLLEMGELNPKQKKGVTHILNNGKHLLDLINEVLDIAGIEAGRQVLTKKPVKLADIINEIIDGSQVAASKKRVTIELADSVANNLFVSADRLRLKQILINLLNNAIKYNNDGGSVTFQTTLKPADEQRKTQVRIAISDTGNGISPEDIGKLFQPFERIGADKTETEGTGLGLMVVKKLTEAMDGRVGVESVVGTGSTLWIELPLADDYQPEMNPSADSITEGWDAAKRIGNILYIEDNISNIRLVEEIIKEHRPGIDLTTSIYGKRAVELAKKHQPGLILLDLNLPDINGIDVLKQLLADAHTKAIPVIIISADAMPFQELKLMKAGAKAYLTKPLNIVNLLKTIDLYI